MKWYIWLAIAVVVISIIYFVVKKKPTTTTSVSLPQQLSSIGDNFNPYEIIKIS